MKTAVIFQLLLTLSFSNYIALGDDHDHDDEHEEPYEWAGSFDVSDHDTVEWIAQKVDGAYADDHMQMFIMEIDSAEEEDLEDADENYAEEILEAGDCTEIDNGGTISMSSTTCYELHFDDSSYQSLFTIDVTDVDYFAVFTEHVPTEFERTSHYLLGTDGEEIEPEHELPEDHDDDEHDDDEDDKEWGLVFLACLLVNLATFSGVAIIACRFLSGVRSSMGQCALLGFSSGALIGCAVFLILIEASHLIASEWRNEGAAAWRWGASVLGGFLTPLVGFVFQPGSLAKFCGLTDTGNVAPTFVGEGDDNENGENSKALEISTDQTESVELKQNQSMSTVLAITFGDFAHNIVDGFAIGIAFKLCDKSLAWGIFAATLYHEIVQELADYVVLTSPSVGLSKVYALAINFFAGTSVIIGGMIATSLDISNSSMGVILAFGGGTYLYIGAVETIPRAIQAIGSVELSSVRKHYAVLVSAFIFGAILVALILFDHEHCDGGSDGDDDDPHAGHGHRMMRF